MSNLQSAVTGRVKLPPHITLGQRAYLGEGVQLDGSHGHLITIEDDAVIAAGARILTHDSAGVRRNGLTWVAPVKVCKRAFVGADALVLPGVTIGEDAVVAAGSVVTDDVAAGVIVAGVPAHPIGTTADFDRMRAEQDRPMFDRRVYNKWPLSTDLLRELDEASSSGGYFFGDSTRGHSQSE